MKIMNVADLDFSSKKFLRLIEDFGLCGVWTWSLITGDQAWSPGFFRLLGLDTVATAPSYNLFLSLVHPEDRHALVAPSDILQGYVLPDSIVRVIRPDGTVRVLSMRSEVRFSFDGKPLEASGIALDVSDRELLKRLYASEQRKREGLYLATYTTPFSLGLDNIHEFPAEMSRLHGPPIEQLNLDPFVMILPEEREAFHDRAWEMAARQLNFQGTARERLVTGEVIRFRIVGVPIVGPDGTYLGRAGFKTPADAVAMPDARLRAGLVQTVEGHHLRAARGLLDWSMTMLAQASGLSLSTVRRLEENAEQHGSRSRDKAVEALRHAGIRFVALDDGTIAVARA